ncbi:hypothetical protein BC628DRAFT_1387325 [Trametes gibbosa]|nr:hypothetical protein BC628DRAFT_1387247 [Trametes gibbosa]KAI0822714.1 hypothetical protein BC628DRAFT_1387325 [Trametes gibbosa]
MKKILQGTTSWRAGKQEEVRDSSLPVSGYQENRAASLSRYGQPTLPLLANARMFRRTLELSARLARVEAMRQCLPKGRTAHMSSLICRLSPERGWAKQDLLEDVSVVPSTSPHHQSGLGLRALRPSLSMWRTIRYMGRFVQAPGLTNKSFGEGLCDRQRFRKHYEHRPSLLGDERVNWSYIAR